MYLSIYIYSESWDIITVIKAGKQLAMATIGELASVLTFYHNNNRWGHMGGPTQRVSICDAMATMRRRGKKEKDFI